jgi:hypothetical protein
MVGMGMRSLEAAEVLMQGGFASECPPLIRSAWEVANEAAFFLSLSGEGRYQMGRRYMAMCILRYAAAVKDTKTGFSVYTLGHASYSVAVAAVNLLPYVDVDDPDDYTPDTDPTDRDMTAGTRELLDQFRENCGPCATDNP